MSQSGGVFDFGKFFPGLDFFTGKGASAWLMPTVSEDTYISHNECRLRH